MKIINYFLFIGFASLLIKLIVFGQDGDGSWNHMHFTTRVIFIWGMLGGFFLWVSMLTDHFKYSRVKNKALWGIFLVFGQMLAASIYFIFIYIRKPQRDIRVGNM